MSETQYKMEELSIEITYKCPFKCKMCSSSASLDKNMPVIPYDKIIEMIDDAKKNCGTTAVSLSGGEPSFHPDFVKIVEYIHNNGLKPLIYTIGLDFIDDKPCVIRDDYIKLFKENDCKVIMPLHGVAKTHNNVVQIDNAFEMEVLSIQKLLENNIEVQIHYVPQVYNYRDFVKVFEFCNELGVKKMSILRFVPQGRGVDQQDFNDFQLGMIMGMMYAVRELCSYVENVEYLNGNDDTNKIFKTNLRIGIPMDFTFLIDDSKKIKSCDGGKSKILVRATGQVNVCPAWKELQEYDAGCIYNQKISDIWINAHTYEMFRDFKKENLTDSRCVGCGHLSDCCGGCAAQRIIAGDFCKGFDSYCFKNKL